MSPFLVEPWSWAFVADTEALGYNSSKPEVEAGESGAQVQPELPDSASRHQTTAEGSIKQSCQNDFFICKHTLKMPEFMGRGACAKTLLPWIKDWVFVTDNLGIIVACVAFLANRYMMPLLSLCPPISILLLRQIFKAPYELMTKFLIELGGNCSISLTSSRRKVKPVFGRNYRAEMCIGSWLCTIPRLPGTKDLCPPVTDF